MTVYLFIFLLILAALLGAPLFTVIIVAAMLGFSTLGIDLIAIPIEIYRIADTPILLALPLFAVAGYILGESRTSSRLVRLTRAFLGWMPASLCIISFIICALFTAFTGASGVTIIALGALLFPALTQSGYPENFSLGLVTTSGSLGLLLPPSLPLILYGIIAQQMGSGPDVTFEDLFLAGLFPAMLMIIILSVYSILANRSVMIQRTAFSMKEALSAVRESIWELPLPFFVLGGIYSGVFAVSEAAAVTALYALVVEVLIYREIPLAHLPRILRDAMIMVGGILVILGVSLAFTNYLIDMEAPMKLFRLCQTVVTSKLVFLVLLNLFLLILGAILDIFSAIIIMVPLILPVAVSYGVHPVHLGIIFLANMQIGYCTPPVGVNLFIASYRFSTPITTIYRAALPFIAVLFAAVLVITYWPWLTMVLLG
ncbi:MAG: TRAP transporter large permease subunit [Desulfobacteraceae bacterium]|nr:MAG: TRAP transporter large permease subunit [Desulfobacteraceae bacterium]